MIVYDVWAEWCAPCKKFGPIFEKVSKDYPGVEFVKVEADINGDFLSKYEIFSIPTILLTDDNGNVLFQHAGIVAEPTLRQIVDSNK